MDCLYYSLKLGGRGGGNAPPMLTLGGGGGGGVEWAFILAIISCNNC